MQRREKLRRVGDFVVPESDLMAAKDEFEHLSTRSRGLDTALRGPIPDEKETWSKNKDRWDYPGVDTPNQTPRHGIFDAALPWQEFDEPSDVDGGDIGVAMGDVGLFESVGESADESIDAGENLLSTLSIE